MRFLLPTIVCLLLGASPASALTAEEIAGAAWPDSPCAGRVVVHYGAGAALDAEYPDGIHDDGATGQPAGGMAASDGSCQVWVRDPRMPNDEAQCDDLVHEYGHLAGRDHYSPENDGVMHDGYWGDPTYHDCYLVGLATPRQEAQHLARQLAPATCRLAAKKRTSWAYRCGPYRVWISVTVRYGAILANGDFRVER